MQLEPRSDILSSAPKRMSEKYQKSPSLRCRPARDCKSGLTVRSLLKQTENLILIAFQSL
jgi:hypothetical protein